MKFFSLFAMCALLTGCGTYGKITENLSKDNATVVAVVGTPWGVQRIIRTNPGTNQDVIISPDNSVTIKSH